MTRIAQWKWLPPKPSNTILRFLDSANRAARIPLAESLIVENACRPHYKFRGRTFCLYEATRRVVRHVYRSGKRVDQTRIPACFPRLHVCAARPIMVPRGVCACARGHELDERVWITVHGTVKTGWQRANSNCNASCARIGVGNVCLRICRLREFIA